MTPELIALTLAGLLQILQYTLMAVPANLELGVGKTLSPRDLDRLGGPIETQLSTQTARLLRALNNHFEGLILFTLAVTVVTLGDKTSALTAFCAWTYLTARILYIPAYAFGWSPWRTVFWFVGFAATTLILLAALL